MKLVGTESARIIAAFSAEELRPESGIYPPLLVKEVGARYNFMKLPNWEHLESGPFKLEFETGHMPGNPRATIGRFTLLAGAFAVDTLSTKDSQAFIEDIVPWAQSTFGLRTPLDPFRYGYLSSIVVDFEHAIEDSLEKLQRMAALVSRRYEANYGAALPQNLLHLAIRCDPLKTPPEFVKPELSIERKVDVPYEKNRYFCSGPFSTDELADVIAEIEQIIRS